MEQWWNWNSMRHVSKGKNVSKTWFITSLHTIPKSKEWFCCNHNFGFVAKARACEGADQKWSPRVTFMFSGVWKSVREWTPHSQWTFESLENDHRGQNPLDWDIPYIIGNFLRRRCLKWARMTHLGSSNINYGQKKGRESNWQFDSRPLKVGNCLNFLACRWYVTYHWKTLDKGYNFS
jgi:hypothetical protein